MVNADVIRISVDSENRVIVEDMYTKGYGLDPIIDEHSDIEYIFGEINGNDITGKFKRFIRPLDKLDSTILLNETMDIVFIIGTDYTVDPTYATV